MNTDSNAVVSLTTELCATLGRLEAALVSLDAEALLTTEEALGRLVDQLASVRAVRGLSADDRGALVASIRRGQDGLLRCRRLGASFTAIARARLSRLTTNGGAEAYGRGGELQGQSVVGASVKVAV